MDTIRKTCNSQPPRLFTGILESECGALKYMCGRDGFVILYMGQLALEEFLFFVKSIFFLLTTELFCGSTHYVGRMVPRAQL